MRRLASVMLFLAVILFSSVALAEKYLPYTVEEFANNYNEFAESVQLPPINMEVLEEEKAKSPSRVIYELNKYAGVCFMLDKSNGKIKSILAAFNGDNTKYSGKVMLLSMVLVLKTSDPALKDKEISKRNRELGVFPLKLTDKKPRSYAANGIYYLIKHEPETGYVLTIEPEM